MKAESIMHAVTECKVVKLMWQLTIFKDELQSLGTQDLLGMIHEIARKRGKEELKLIIALCWTAWHERNQFVFERKVRDP